jgi:hypothetical protein
MRCEPVVRCAGKFYNFSAVSEMFMVASFEAVMSVWVSDKNYWQVYIRPARGRRKDKLLHGRFSWEKKTFI